MTPKSQKTVDSLKAKAESNWTHPKRMPSLTAIASVLDELGIPYEMRDSSNTVERRTKGCRYVNSRHRGKEGKLMRVGNMTLDTSDSYYSYNTWHYAKDLLKIINEKGGE